MKKHINYKIKIALFMLCLFLCVCGISSRINNKSVIADELNEKTPVISESFIRGVREKSSCFDFNSIYGYDIHGCEYIVYDSLDNVITISNVAHTISTGDYIIDGKNNKYEIVVSGDVRGDGKVDTTDTALLKMFFEGKYDLTGCYKKAADTNNDDIINGGDYIRIKYHIISEYNIYDNQSFEPDPIVSDDTSSDHNESGWTPGWH